MIIKPRRRGGFKQFSDYLQGKAGNENDNEAVNLVANSLGLNSINDFCILTSKIAAPKLKGRCPLKRPIEHIAIRTRKGDILTAEAIKGKVPELLKKLGYQDCPWVLVQHIKDGEPHYHLGIVRIDPTGKVPNPKSKEICFNLAQKFALELGFKPSFDQANADRHTQQKVHLARLWGESEGLSSADRLKKFQKGGFTPARGDRGQLIFVDRSGKPHSLHRIPALKEQGLKQADFPAAFGLDNKKMAALPTLKAAQRDMGNRGWASGVAVLTILWGLSRLSQCDELRQVRGTGDRDTDRKQLTQRPSPKPRSLRVQATRGWWVAARAAGAYESMIAAGYTADEAELAVDRVYEEEEQRLTAEQRYLDYLHGYDPKRGELAVNKPPPAHTR